MDPKDFDSIVENRLGICKNVLCQKDKEYSSDTDRLHNFKRSGAEQDCTPIKALDGMFSKHRVSFRDIVERMETDPYYCPSKKIVDEKFTDNINYILLAEGLVEERRKELKGIHDKKD